MKTKSIKWEMIKRGRGRESRYVALIIAIVCQFFRSVTVTPSRGREGESKDAMMLAAIFTVIEINIC